MTAGFPATAWFYWIGGGVLALFGLWLLYWSLLRDRSRGRRRCPRCWYDMSGTPTDVPQQGMSTCSECGKVVTRERKLFKTRRRWPCAVAAMALILLGPGGASWQTRKYDWNSVKPLWLLLRQGQTDSPSGTAARGEVVRRVQNKLLSDSQLQSAIDHALTIQADPNAFWMKLGPPQQLTCWGDVVEEAWTQGKLSKEQLEQYARHGFEHSFSITTRPRIRQGSEFPVRFRGTLPRFSQRHWSFAVSGSRLMAFGIPNHVEGAEFVKGYRPMPYTVGTSSSPGWETSPMMMTELPPGLHEIRIDWDFWVLRHNAGQPVSRSSDTPVEDDPNLLAKWSASFVLPIEVVPADEEVVKRAPDPSMMEVIQKAIQVEFVQDKLTTGRTTFGGPNGMILIDPLPTALAFDVYARADGREEHIGAIASSAQRNRTDNAQRIHRHPRLVFPNAQFVDVILRTNTRAAEQEIDIDQIWDGEIVFTDVPIRETIEGQASRPSLN